MTTLVLLCAVSVATAIGNAGMQSILPAIGRELSLPDPFVAGIFALSALMSIIASPLWAHQSDIRGRKPIILVGVAGFVISMTCFGAVVMLGVEDVAPPLMIFGLFLLARGLNGALATAAAPASQAYIADRTPPEERTRAIATLAGAFGFGTIFGPLVAPLLVGTPLGLAGPMIYFACAGVFMFALVWRLLPADATEAEPGAGGPAANQNARRRVRMADLWRDERMRPFIVYALVAGICAAGVTQTVGFTIMDRLRLSPMAALPYITLAMAVGSSTTVVGQWVLIPLFRLRPSHLLQWGAGLTAAGCAVTVLDHGFASALAGFALFSLGVSLARPGFTAGASLVASHEAQATTAGILSSLAGGTFLLAPLFVALHGVSDSAPFIIACALMAGLVVYAAKNRALAGSGRL